MVDHECGSGVLPLEATDAKEGATMARRVNPPTFIAASYRVQSESWWPAHGTGGEMTPAAGPGNRKLFPDQPQVFLHRCGRHERMKATNGRSGRFKEFQERQSTNSLGRSSNRAGRATFLASFPRTNEAGAGRDGLKLG